MYKKIMILGLMSVLLTGCFGSSDGGGGDTLTLEAGEKLYSQSNFSIIIPQDWDVIESKDFTSNVPSGTVVDFRNNIKNEIFTANVHISIETLDEKTTSSDFAKSSKSKISTSLLSFTEIGNENVEFPYGETALEAIVLEFSGKKSADEPVIQFKQLYVVNKGIGYIVTAGFLPEEDQTVVKYIDRMLNSFSLK